MRTGILIALSLFSFLTLTAQESITFSTKNASVHSSLEIPPGTKVGGTATLRIEVKPGTDWHVYSLEETGAYKNTVIVFSESCAQIEAKGAPAEQGEKITEFDDIMGGNLNFFEGPAVFTQEITLKGKKPRVEGFIEFQLCNGDKCIVMAENFKLEGKVK